MVKDRGDPVDATTTATVLTMPETDKTGYPEDDP